MMRFKGATGAADTKSVGVYAAGNTEQAPMPVEIFGADGATPEVQGAEASGAPATANPVLTGGRYDSTELAAVDDGDVVPFFTDEHGRLRVINDGLLSPFAGDQVGCAPFSVPIEGAHTQDTSIDSVTTITPTGDYLIIQATVAGKNIRITFDGTNPTTSLGFVIVAQDPPVRIPTAGKTFKIIAETAGAAADWQNEQSVA